jgi:acyl dehydratase
MTDLATVHVGDRLPTHRFTIDRLDLVRYCGASGDFNVIHWSDRAAGPQAFPTSSPTACSPWRAA